MKTSSLLILLATVLSLSTLRATVPGAFAPGAYIYPADAVVRLRFRPVTDEAKQAFKRGAVKVDYIREDGRFSDGGFRHLDSEWENLPWRPEYGAVAFTIKLGGEFEHTFRFWVPGSDGKKRILADVVLISLRPDLFALKPFKCDLHQQSTRSDGLCEPWEVAGHSRRVGLDCMALTDHRMRAPSMEVVALMQKWQCGMTAYPGEEFHTALPKEDGVLHSIALGAHCGINDWSQAHPEEMEKLIQAELKKEPLASSELDASDARDAAVAAVLYRFARENGAKLIFYSHPYWRPHGRFNAPNGYNEYMMRHADCDAVEIPSGGNSVMAAQLTEAMRFDLAAAGRVLPVVGISDSHDQAHRRFGWQYSIIFAPDSSLESIAAAVKDHRSVGVQTCEGVTPLCYGSFRYVKYVYFLLKNYLPVHDELCRRQGELLLRDHELKTSARDVAELTRAIDALREQFWYSAPKEK